MTTVHLLLSAIVGNNMFSMFIYKCCSEILQNDTLCVFFFNPGHTDKDHVSISLWKKREPSRWLTFLHDGCALLTILGYEDFSEKSIFGPN